MSEESVEVRIARIEEAVKSQGKGVQEIKDSLSHVTASLKEISKQMVEANTSVMGYFTSLSTKHQVTDEKLDRFTDQMNRLEKNKVNVEDFRSYKDAVKERYDQREAKLQTYIDKVEEGLKTRLDTNSSLIDILEKYQVSQTGGWKYFVGGIGVIGTTIAIVWGVIRLGAK